MKLLTRLGHLIEEEGITYMARTDSIDPDDVLMPLQAASSTYRIAMGPRAGRKVLSLQYAPRRAVPPTQQLCANAHGFSLHTGVRCDADQRSALEQLCRYVTRPAIVNERLSVNRAGQVVLCRSATRFKVMLLIPASRPWQHGGALWNSVDELSV